MNNLNVSSLTKKVKLVFAFTLLIGINSCDFSKKDREKIKLEVPPQSTADKPGDLNEPTFLTSPFNLERCISYKRIFNYSYYQVNQLANRDFKNDTIAVQLSEAIISKLDSNKANNDLGLVFHYALSGTFDRIEYILSLGSVDEDSLISVIPFEDKNGTYYILLDGTIANSGNSTRITQRVFEAKVKSYKENILMISEGRIAKIDTMDNHPRMMYHQGDQLFKFYVQNKMPSFLYIAHGMGPTIGESTPFQVPLLLLGDQNGPFPIDNDPHDEGEYYRKAADLGWPCPPYCKD